MKKILAALLTVATVITCAFAFTACDKKGGGATEKIKMVWFHKFIIDSIDSMLILFGCCYASFQ